MGTEVGSRFPKLLVRHPRYFCEFGFARSLGKSLQATEGTPNRIRLQFIGGLEKGQMELSEGVASTSTAASLNATWVSEITAESSAS